MALKHSSTDRYYILSVEEERNAAWLHAVGNLYFTEYAFWNPQDSSNLLCAASRYLVSKFMFLSRMGQPGSFGTGPSARGNSVLCLA